MTDIGKSGGEWKLAVEDLKNLKTHDRPTIPVEALPLDAIARYSCRKIVASDGAKA